LLALDRDRTVTPLVQTMFAERNGEISPDGRWLAYESDESGQFQVYLRPFPAVDGGRQQLSTNGGRQPAWTRSGREMVYVAPDGTLMGVPIAVNATQVGFAAGAPARLVGNEGYYYAWNDLNQGRTYDVAPDGNRFLRLKESSERTASPGITVVLSWTEELKRLVPTN
jgi:serine/threonine-protein kinase